jgi:hypothetical protein
MFVKPLWVEPGKDFGLFPVHALGHFDAAQFVPRRTLKLAQPADWRNESQRSSGRRPTFVLRLENKLMIFTVIAQIMSA